MERATGGLPFVVVLHILRATGDGYTGVDRSNSGDVRGFKYSVPASIGGHDEKALPLGDGAAHYLSLQPPVVYPNNNSYSFRG